MRTCLQLIVFLCFSAGKKGSCGSNLHAPRSGRVGMGSSSSPSRLHPAGYRSSHRTYGSPSVMSSATYRRSGAPGRVFSSMQDSMDLTQSTAVTNELKIIRTNEKEQLQGLNDRFVSFIEKVHNLEQQNKVLEPSLEALLDEIAFLRKVHEEELQEMQASLQATQVLLSPCRGDL
uniref:IF rod domain-containing protein n=1 Tax=Labrus bergylta TaxID=56723 RepID=A0A3Q3EW89_9LABR